MSRTTSGAGRSPSEGIRLLGPDLAALPAVLPAGELDGPQQDALELLLGGADVMVHGGPASGRTTLALAAAAQAGRGLCCWRRDATPPGACATLSPCRERARCGR